MFVYKRIFVLALCFLSLMGCGTSDLSSVDTGRSSIINAPESSAEPASNKTSISDDDPNSDVTSMEVTDQLEKEDESTAITIGITFSPDNTLVWNLVEAFNDISDTYQVELIDYSSAIAVDSPDSAHIELMEKILNSDESPDMVIASHYQTTYLAGAGLLEDMNQVIDPDTILPWLWSTVEVNGCNYSLPLGFSFDTVCGKVDQIGENQNISVNEFLNLDENGIPILDEMTNYRFLSALANELQHCYVDLESRTSSFSSNDFVALLEYAASLPEEVEFTIGNGYEYLRYDTAQVLNISVHDFQTLHQYETVYVDATLNYTGWPGESGGSIYVLNSVALSKNSENKAGAIEFLNFLLSDSVQVLIAETDFPITASGFDIMCETAMSVSEGTLIMGGGTTTIDGINYSFTPLTSDEIEKYSHLLQNAHGVYFHDSTIAEFIYKEGTAVFNGQQTAEEAASRIDTLVASYFEN